MKHLGITGTRRGMTERQKDMLAHLLAICRTRHGFDTFHDGDCIGADVEARAMAASHGFRLIVHPSTARTRAFVKMGHEIREPKPPLERNYDIVNESDLMIGCPGEDHEVLRSGAWACLRYTGKAKTRTVIIWPSGECGTYPEGYRRGSAG